MRIRDSPNAFRGLDGGRVIMLLCQAALAFFAAVSFSNVLDGGCDNFRGFVVAHADPFIARTIEVFTLRQSVRLARETQLYPFLESGPHHTAVDPTIAVETASKRQPFL